MQGNLLLEQFSVGDRIELAPHVDRRIRGDRYGEIVKIGGRFLHVLMDRSEKVLYVVPENVGRKLDGAA